MNYHAISQDSDRTTLELRRDLIVEAQFNNSPVQPHSDELYQIDPTRLSDSRLKKLLDSAANLINQFSDQFTVAIRRLPHMTTSSLEKMTTHS